VSDSRVLRGIFGPGMKLTEGWRKLYSGEIHNLYSSLNIIRIIKWRRMGWVYMKYGWWHLKFIAAIWVGNQC
jgi:hypothetical protein